ncbi:NUDIX domain-containing protein [Candidatus Leptofilum sp.]|uniref:NUDIX domain-containing protein n=1 Tax=Candidatus Leptofilum sp. TaxID=3241576 RepID=UPI003B599698
MATIVCYDIYGNAVPVAAESITFRPAVYGIYIENSQILLQKQPETGLWHPPGTMLTASDTPTQVIRQYFRQLVGLTPAIGSLLFVEDQYFLDEARRAWKLSAMYYGLERPLTTATALIETDETNPTEWIPLANLQRDQFQFGYEAVQAGKLQQKL